MGGSLRVRMEPLRIVSLREPAQFVLGNRIGPRLDDLTDVELSKFHQSLIEARRAPMSQ